MRQILVFSLLCLFSSAASAASGRLAFPIRDPNGPPVPAPAYLGDRVTLHLTAEGARAAWPMRRMGSARLARLGVPSLDRATSELGIWLEPKFQGRTPPETGSRLHDLTAFYVAHLPPGLDLETALDRLSRISDVASAEPIAILPVSGLPPSDTLFTSSYWFEQPSGRDLHALEAWAVTTGDTSVVVAILDTGLLSSHPDLGGDGVFPSQIWTNPVEASGLPGVDDDHDNLVDDLHGWDFVNLSSQGSAVDGEDWGVADNDPSDYLGHGTAVAGIVGAITDNVHGIAGTAWNLRLMPLKIGWACGSNCGEVNMEFVADAVDYAAMHGASVINCSFESVADAALTSALDNATAAGVTIVSAAGNNNRPVDTTNNYLALRPDVISVTSVDQNDVMSFFSNYGPQVDLAAPGQQIASTWLVQATPPVPTYHTSLNGTSFSAPFVTGAVALMQARQWRLGRDPLTPLGVALRLDETTDDISDVNPLRAGHYGSGRLNLFRAISEAWSSAAIRVGGQISGAVAIVPVNGGGSRVAFATFDRHIVILDGTTLDTVAVAPLPYTPASSVAAGPIGPGGGAGFFVGCLNLVVGVRHNGIPLPGWPAIASNGVQLVSPAVGDLDGDGAYEVVSGDDAGQVWAWHIADPSSPVSGFPARVAPSGVVKIALSRIAGGAGVTIIATAEDGTLVGLGPNGQPLSPDWQISLGAAPTLPVEVVWEGTPTIVVAAGTQLHAFRPDATERPGFPVDLGATAVPDEEAALGDLDLDGSDDVVLVTSNPDRIDVRDSSGASKSALLWPRAVGTPAMGSPVVGQLAASPAPEVMVKLASGLTAFSATTDSLPGFPKRGDAGKRLTLMDLDGDASTEVLTGTITGPPVLFAYDAGPGSAMSPARPWITFRGNFARTGSRGYAPATSIDGVPPARITDLRAVVRGPGSVVLLWTAPGDDGSIGQATGYEIRRSSIVLDQSNFALAGQPVPAGTPAGPNTPDSLVVTGLTPGETVHFALRARDEEGNLAPVSNDVAIQISVVVPTLGLALAPSANPSRLPAGFRWQADPNAVGSRQAIRIHDLGGRVVRTIELGTGAGGTAAWDGTDDDGRRLPAGLYLVRLVSGRYHAEARIVLLP